VFTVDLIVLGAGPAYTNRAGSSGACYLVRESGTHVLLDLGQGSFTRIFPEVPPEALDAVVISHLHPDHFIDLVPLRHYLRYEFRPSRRVRVLGPRDTGARLDALHGEQGFAGQSLDIETLGERERTIGAVRLDSRLVTHNEESYAFRISAREGPGLVYSGDCGRAEDLAPLIRPGDTLLVEIAFGAGPVPPGVMHLDGPAIGRVAREAGPGRVLLTHLQMGFDADEALASVQAAYDGPVAFVWPGSRLAL
jgi:ribonuclease BN (tRNA processing enzyme)